jgi:ribosomal protein L40E
MIEAFLSMNDMILRTLGGITLVAFGVALWALLQRGEFSNKCPRCGRRMPKTASRCKRCGWSSHTRTKDTRKPWSGLD